MVSRSFRESPAYGLPGHTLLQTIFVNYGIINSIFRLFMDIASRFFDTPPQSFFLLGPRGTGKSTWLRDQLPESLFLDLLEPELYRSLQLT